MSGINKITKEQMKLMLEKNIIHPDMIVNVYGPRSSEYKILEINEINNTYVFTLQELVSSKRDAIFKVPYKFISHIEEMDVDRFIKAYAIEDELAMLIVANETNVKKDVIGKETASIEGRELEDDMKIMLLNDKTKKYNKKILTVRGVGEKIELIAPRGRPKKNG